MNNIKETLKVFIVENFLFGEDDDLNDDTSFLDDGIIDSTGVLELVEFIEEQFNFKIDDEDMVPENLDSLNNLEQYISKQISAS